MRFITLTAVSALALAVAAPALAQDAMAPATPAPAAALATADAISDAQLTSFNTAMTKVREVTAASSGGQLTTEQQAEMATAIEAAGLSIEQFNDISGKLPTDDVLRARLTLLNTAPSAPGSVGAGVTEAEIGQFTATMVKMRELAPPAGTAPSAEQQAQMAAAVQESGLAVDRFNAIAQAVSADAGLRARVQLADARRSAS